MVCPEYAHNGSTVCTQEEAQEAEPVLTRTLDSPGAHRFFVTQGPSLPSFKPLFLMPNTCLSLLLELQ